MEKETPRTVVLHQNPAFIFLANESQPLTQDFYAMLQFLIKKSREKTYVQLYNFFPGDKAARTLDKYVECTFFQHLVVCNNRVYPFTPLTYLFTKHCRRLPSVELINQVIDNSDARLHPDPKFLSALEKQYKDILSDNRILTHSRPNAPGNQSTKDKNNTPLALAGQIIPDPRLIYQTYSDLGFTVLHDVLSHPSPYCENTVQLIKLLLESETFKQNFKRYVYYKDEYVSGYFDYKIVEQYKKLKTQTDHGYALVLFDPVHEERYSTPERIVMTSYDGWYGPEYISETDSDLDLFASELRQDPFFIMINSMCQAYHYQYHKNQHRLGVDHSATGGSGNIGVYVVQNVAGEKTKRSMSNHQYLQYALHCQGFNKNTLFFPNGTGSIRGNELEFLHHNLENDDGYNNNNNNTALMSPKDNRRMLGKSKLDDRGLDDDGDGDDDDEDKNITSEGLLHRPFDDFFSLIYELLLAHTTSLHLTKDQLEVGRELMAAQAHDDSDDEGGRDSMRRAKKDKKEKKKISASKDSTDNHNYMYRASGALLLAIRGRSQPNVDFIEYLIHVHRATATVSMYSFHNLLLWLLASCTELEIEKFRWLLQMLLDEAGCDVLSVKYQHRIHQGGAFAGLKQGDLNQSIVGSVTGIGGHSTMHHAEDSRVENSRLISTNQLTTNGISVQHNHPENSTNHSVHNGQTPENSLSGHKSSLLGRFSQLFVNKTGNITKTLAKQYSFDYFSLVLLYCLTSPRMTTYQYTHTLMTTLYSRLVTHQSSTQMSLVVSRQHFSTFNRDHIHSAAIEYLPLFTAEQSLLADKKHVTNTLILYYMVYGNLRLSHATEVYHFLQQHQPFKPSAFPLLFRSFLTLHTEQYFGEHRNKTDHHLYPVVQQYHQDINQAKIKRFGNIAVDCDWSTFITSQGNGRGDDSDDDDDDDERQDDGTEEDRYMLDLKLDPHLLLPPRSPLLTEPGYLFLEMLIQEYWQHEVKKLKTDCHYDEDAVLDVQNFRNGIYNEQFLVFTTTLLTNIVNSTVFSPQDGTWMYKVVEKVLSVAKADILAHRRETSAKFKAMGYNYQTQSLYHATYGYANNQNYNQVIQYNNKPWKVVNLSHSEHYTDLSLFTHSTTQPIDFAFKLDCTRLFHTPIPVSMDIVRALQSLLVEQYNVVLVYYQQYFNKTTTCPYAYHIYHSVLEKPVSEELPNGLTDGLDQQQPSGQGQEPRHRVVLLDDDEDTHDDSTKGNNNNNNSNNNSPNNHNNKRDKEEEKEQMYKLQLIGAHYGRTSLATHGADQSTVRYDPSDIKSVILTTYASTIKRIEIAKDNVEYLRSRNVESFLRYRGSLPAVYGLLRATSQQAITTTWFALFDLLICTCRDIFLTAKITRSSPLSAFLVACLSFDTNSTAVAKWLLQPPMNMRQIQQQIQAVDDGQRVTFPSVTDFLHLQLCPPPPPQRLSITSTEYTNREIFSTISGENQHFDYVEALYALVTAPAPRHNQTYKQLLEKMLLFVHPEDLNLLSFDPNSVLTSAELQQQELAHQSMSTNFDMNKSVVAQYLSHLAHPTQMSIDIFHLLLRAGGKVHLANLSTNQSPLIYFVQQQTHRRCITREFFDIFRLLFNNYGHCGNLLLTNEKQTLFELALSHIQVIDAIAAEYLLFLLSTSHVSYRHSLGYPDVMDQLALLEQNKAKRLIAPVLSVDRADGLWSKTHKLIDAAWVESTGNTLFSNQQQQQSGKAKKQYQSSPLTREEFATLFDFYYSCLYLAPSARYYSVVHALANHRDQHIVATLFGNVPNHDMYLYYHDQTRNTTLKDVIIAALNARKKELNNYLQFAINLEIVDCIENVENCAEDDVAENNKNKGGDKKNIGTLFKQQWSNSATPSTAPAIPEWATALSDTMHLNFSQKRQRRTVFDGTTGILWYIINNVQNPRTEDIVTLLNGLTDENGQSLSTPVSLSYVNSNSETPLMHAILRRWSQDNLVFLIQKIGPENVLKQRDNNGRTAYDYMVACCTELYAPDAFALLRNARK